MQIKNQITFKPIRKLCLNFIEILKHNNRIIYEIFILLTSLRDMIYIFLKYTFRSRSIVLLVMSIEHDQRTIIFPSRRDKCAGAKKIVTKLEPISSPI